MSCLQTVVDYGLRSLGYGERLLPRSDITLCEQFTLIGSGMIWNVYFALMALGFGFFFAVLVGLGKNAQLSIIRKPTEWFVFIFRGSPLFIQFFFAYVVFLKLKAAHPIFDPFSAAWLGAAIVLFLNTSAYSAEIFYGAFRTIPKGEVEAADAYGFRGWKRFRRIIWPSMLRVAWPSYTNEALFLFHATTLVFFTGFPAWQQRGDALYYANYFAKQTFNPFIPYPILAMYFIIFSLSLMFLFSQINRHLNRHLPREAQPRLKIRPQLFR